MTKQGKPTGDSVFFRFQAERVDECRVVLPSTKPEIEDWILERAVRSAARAGTPLFGGVQALRNREDDFDYTLQAPDGPEYLDLMESFVLPQGTTGTHASAAPVYSPRDRAERIASLVADKSSHYGRQSRPLHLLLYSTDWRLHLSPPVAQFVAVALSRLSHVFTTITYFAPIDAEHGFVFRAWPLTQEQLADYEARARRAALVILPDPRELEARADGMSFTIDLTKLRDG